MIIAVQWWGLIWSIVSQYFAYEASVVFQRWDFLVANFGRALYRQTGYYLLAGAAIKHINPEWTPEENKTYLFMI